MWHNLVEITTILISHNVNNYGVNKNIVYIDTCGFTMFYICFPVSSMCIYNKQEYCACIYIVYQYRYGSLNREPYAASRGKDFLKVLQSL